MCGRYSLYAPRSEIARRYRIDEDRLGPAEARYNIPPGTDIPLIATLHGDSGPLSVLMPSRWGFHPPWAGDDAPSPINARAEDVASGGYFRDAFATHRALVPANGWYEWRDTGTGTRQPFFVTRSDGGLMMLAALWQPSRTGDGSSCAIITRPAARELSHIHPRMPVVLDPACWNAWLDPALTDRARIREAARPIPANVLIAYPVDPRANSPVNDDASVVLPLQPAARG